jgi:dTMP kinase
MKRFATYGETLAGISLEDLSGWLIVIEGTDGVGRTTHVDRLRKRLEEMGYAVAETGLTRSDLASRGIRRAKLGNTLGSNAFNLFYATDFADRLEQQIIPALRSGFVMLTDRYIYSLIARAIVLADRYVYTAFARDVARGVSRSWVRSLYRFAVLPTLAIYFRVPLDVALYRILSGRPKLKFYEAGMDLGLHGDVTESYKLFQRRIQDEYEAIVSEYGLAVMDATRPVELQQRAMRQLILPYVKGGKLPPQPKDSPILAQPARREVTP